MRVKREGGMEKEREKGKHGVNHISSFNDVLCSVSFVLLISYSTNTKEFFSERERAVMFSVDR